MLLDCREIVPHIFHFVLHCLVELFQHIEEHISGMVAQITLVQNGIHLEHFREFVERVDGIVVRGDEKIAPDHKIYLLFARFVRVPERREVQDEVDVSLIKFRTRLDRGKEQFFGDQRRDSELVHNVPHLVAARRFEVDPDQPVVFIARMHGNSI